MEKFCPAAKCNVTIDVTSLPYPTIDGSIDTLLLFDVKRCSRDCDHLCGLQKNDLRRGIGQPRLTDPE